MITAGSAARDRVRHGTPGPARNLAVLGASGSEGWLLLRGSGEACTESRHNIELGKIHRLRCRIS